MTDIPIIDTIIKPNVKLKTYHYYSKNKNDNIILDYMTTISKNIYNSTLYCYKVYKQFEDNIYEDLYNEIIKCKYVDQLEDVIKNNKLKKLEPKKKIKNKDNTGKREKKDDIIINIEEKLYNIYDKYYDFYSFSKNIIDNNNKIIYKYIIENIKENNIIINKNNISDLFKLYKVNIIKLNNIIFDDSNEKLVIDNIINGILNSCYYKTVYYIKNLLDINQEKKIDKKYKDIIEIVKNNDFYIEKVNKFSFKIKEDLCIPITTIQNLIGRVTLQHLNENKEKIPGDVIGNIISKMYSNISSYYELLKSGKQKNISFCKYLQKDEKFNLFYYCRSFKVEDDQIRLNVGKYINDNYNNFIKIDLQKILIGKKIYYYNISDLCDKKINITYIKINDKFIEKLNLKSFNYIYLNLPKKIKENNISLIEIKSNKYNKNIKIYIIYEHILKSKLEPYNLNKFDKLKLDDKLKKSISIDTGINNLLTIYDPIGEQFIIKGGKILSINHFYNKKIDYLKSINKKNYNKNTFNRLYSLESERQNKINGYFNNIVCELIKKYKEKELFIIGYNCNWKTNVNLGKINNRNFYQIPYRRLIFKLDEALKLINKKLLIVKESYTSICDSLALEEINFHNTYLGKRKKRGLFSSSTNKLLNADINGAINIMRKQIPLIKITGTNLCNPKLLKI